MNPGRVLEIALILGKHGHPEYYQHAEQILRAHLLPSQLNDISWIPAINNEHGLDEFRNVAQRIQGSWGTPAPYGLKTVKDEVYGNNILFAQDIVGHVLTSLSEAYLNATEYNGKEHKVNLLFDHKNDNIEVKSPYTNEGFKIYPKRQGNILVRMPSWTNVNEVKVTGGIFKPELQNGYLNVKPNAGEIVINFPLIKRELDLSYLDEKIRVRLKGDQIMQMDNFGADLTFFDSFE
jgi:hypothetical protein